MTAYTGFPNCILTPCHCGTHGAPLATNGSKVKIKRSKLGFTVIELLVVSLNPKIK